MRALYWGYQGITKMGRSERGREMNPHTESSSDEFSGRLGLIFATIGAAIGTGNIWRFPRMVGAN